MEFTTDPPSIDTSSVPAAGTLVLNSSTISDSSGNLLFYCNGEICWDRNHDAMPNGGSLLGDEHATQNSMIIPNPGNPDRYFVFTLDIVNGGEGLRYYIVDMTFNSGLGDVVSPGIQLDDTLTEKLCATKHANDLDYWVVVHDWGNNEFQAYHIDTFGVNNTPVISTVGLVHSGLVNAAKGQMKISPDGTRLAIANWLTGFVQLFDFDPATGQVTNPITLKNNSNSVPFGIEFSVDSRKLYYSERVTGSTAGRIFQYDLDHINTDCLLASENVVFQMGSALQIPSSMQLGLNEKIYMGSNYFSNHDELSVVHDPIEYGTVCDFQENDFDTERRLTEGLTSFISTYLAGGIHVEFATTCDGAPTVFFPEDSLGLDSVRWNFGDPSTGTANTSTDMEPSHIFSNPDTFLVTLYSHRGNHTDTFLRQVIIWDTAMDILGNDTTICNSSSVTFTADWYDACLEWSTGSTNSSITVSSEGWYWVDIAHQSCLFRDSVYVTEVVGAPQFSLGNDTSVCLNVNFTLDPDLQDAYYTWQDGSHDTVFQVTSTGIYSLTATNACGSTVDTINVTLNQQAQPVLNFPEDTVACDTVEMILDVTFENAVYEWSDGTTDPIKEITDPGVYWVQVGNECDTVWDTIEVAFIEPMESMLDDRYVLCDDEDTIDVTATLNSQSINWSLGSSSPNLQITQPGQVWFEAENECGLLSDTMQVLMWDTAFELNLGSDTTVCDESIQFTLGYTEDAYPFNYLWSNGSTATTIDVTFGIYSLTLTNGCGSVDDERRILVADPITIQDPLENVICEGESIRVVLTSADVRSATWSHNATGVEVTLIEAGTYSVSIIDSAGCSFTDSVSFGDECPPLVYIPNVFTANGDGVNDEFCLKTENIKEVSIVIFNRWGMKVFETTEMDACWDGAFNGNAMGEGVYYYQINVLDNSNESTSHRGSVSLLR